MQQQQGDSAGRRNTRRSLPASQASAPLLIKTVSETVAIMHDQPTETIEQPAAAVVVKGKRGRPRSSLPTDSPKATTSTGIDQSVETADVADKLNEGETVDSTEPQSKNSTGQMSDAAEIDTSNIQEKPKGKRGRKPKSQNTEQLDKATPIDTNDELGVIKSKRVVQKRQLFDVSAAPKSKKKSPVVVTGKKRGRKPKSANTSDSVKAEAASSSSTKGQKPRPRRYNVDEEDEEIEEDQDDDDEEFEVDKSVVSCEDEDEDMSSEEDIDESDTSSVELKELKTLKKKLIKSEPLSSSASSAKRKYNTRRRSTTKR
jgi:hypothetical protein